MTSLPVSVAQRFSAHPTARHRALVEELARRLHAGENMSLYGPLDTGKSALLRLLGEQMGEEKAVIYVDFADEISEL